MDDVYKVFKGHVQAIRGGRLKKPIDELAGGRVFTGKQALELGLVDKIGGLGDAIAHVAGEAKLTDYDVRIVPAPKNFLEQLIEEASGAGDDAPGLDIRSEAGGRRARVAGRPRLADAAAPRPAPGRRRRRTHSAISSYCSARASLLMMPEIAIPR